MSFINQYSFPLAAAVTVIALGILLRHRGLRSGDGLALGALVVGFVMAFFLLHPGASSLDEADAVRDRIGDGTPVLLELQSPY